MYSNQRMGFRIQQTHNKTRYLYLTINGMQNIVTSSFVPQFPDIKLNTHPNNTNLEVTDPLFVAEISGVPLSTRNSLDSLVESMKRAGGSSIYQVWIRPRKPGYFSRKLVERKYKSALEKVQLHDNTVGWLGTSEPHAQYDVGALNSLEWHKAAYERMCSDVLLECRVILAFWGTQMSDATFNMALNTLLSAISHTGKKEKMSTKIHTGKNARRILLDSLHLGDEARGTQLLPKEAASLFEIPYIELIGQN